MGIIHKRQIRKLQVLIFALLFSSVALAKGKKSVEGTTEDAQILAIVQKAAKKQEFSKEIQDIVSQESKAIPTLISVFKSASRSWQERWFSAMALAKFPQEKTKRVLIEGTQDPLSIVRSASIEALGSFDDPDVIAAVKKAMDDPSLMVRLKAVHFLGSKRDRGSAGILGEELFAQRNYYRGQPIFGIRESIVEALGNIGSLNSVDPLIRVFSEEPKNPKLQTLACSSLEKIVQPSKKEGKPLSCPEYWLKWYKNPSAPSS